LRYLIGIGNCTASDDGVGVRVVEHIVATHREQGFRAIDLGANSLNLVDYLDADTEAILVVDAAKIGGLPGEYALFSPSAAESQKPLTGISTHEGDLLRVIELARTAGYVIPRVEIMGIEPASLEYGLELSPALRARLDDYVAAALARLSEL